MREGQAVGRILAMKIPALIAATALLLSLPAVADIVAEGGWARATVPGAKEGAGYVTLRNTGTESRNLLRLTTPVCDELSLHLSSVDANGVSHMWPLAKLELKPGETVRFEPNGKHMMFRGLTSPLVAGKTVAVTFEFEDEKPLTVQLQIKPLVADMPGMSMDHSTTDRSKH
jgi:periplasmic copper chaperone A